MPRNLFRSLRPRRRRRAAPPAGSARAGQFFRRLSCEQLEPRWLLSRVFDFGIEYVGQLRQPSPVEAGATMVAATPYSQAQGWGWVNPTDPAVDPVHAIWGADRTPAAPDQNRFSPLETDLNFTQDGTFRVDLTANQTYRVDLTLGDHGNFDHDGMAVYLNDNVVAVASTVAGGDLDVSHLSYTLTVGADGVLRVRLRDLGGLDPNVAIEGLAVTEAPADTIAPNVVTVSQAAGQPGTMSADPINFTVVFSEPVSGFTNDRVTLPAALNTAFTAAALASATIVVSGQGSIYNVMVGGMDTTGNVVIQVPNSTLIQDLSGNDLVGAVGTATVEYYQVVAPGTIQRFDFVASGSSPVNVGWTRIAPTTTYIAGTQAGWTNTGGRTSFGGERFVTVDDAAPTAQNKVRDHDFNATADNTFSVDLTAGKTYWVEITLGDLGLYGHDNTEVLLSGVDDAGFALAETPLDLVSTAPGELAVLAFPITKTTAGVPVSFRIRDSGVLDQVDPNAVIESLVITEAPLNMAGFLTLNPTAIITPAASQATTTGNKHVNFTVKFDRPVQNFAAGDVSVPGTETIESVTGQGTTYNVRVNYTGVPLTASVTAGLVVAVGGLTDLMSNPLGGSSPVAVVQYDSSLGPARLFDFGTAASPAEPTDSATVGAAVNETTLYPAGTAPRQYGWINTPPQSVDRGQGAGSALERDLCFGSRATFQVDFAAGGLKAVDLVLGDQGDYAHDYMQVFLNGILFDTVSTKRHEVVRKSYDVSLLLLSATNPLIVDLLDAGGLDPNVAIEGLEIW